MIKVSMPAGLALPKRPQEGVTGKLGTMAESE